MHPSLSTTDGQAAAGQDQSPTLLNLLTRQLFEGLIFLDDDRQVIFASGPAEMLLGSSPGGLLGRSADELFNRQDIELPPLSAGQTHRFVANSSPTPDGERPLAVTMTHLELENISYTAISLAALSDLDSWEQQLVLTDRLASIGLLTTSIAHELTNPLSIILTTCTNLEDMLQETEGLPRVARRYLSLIQSNGLRCVQLIDSLRSYAHSSPLRQEMQLGSLARHVVDLLAPDFENRKGFRLVVDAEESLPAVWCDPNQIMQVLINLLINARDAMGAAGGDITIQLRELADLNAVSLAVLDNGPGVDEADLPHLFKPFYTTKERGEGTGLGLFIVNEIVRQHDGWLRVHNRRDGTGRPLGAQFTAILPRP